MAAPSPENLEMRPSPVSSTRTRSKMGLEPSQHKRQAVHELRTRHSSTRNNTNNPEAICPRSCRTSSPECPKRPQVNAGLQAKSKGVVSQDPWLTTRQLLRPVAPALIPIHINCILGAWFITNPKASGPRTAIIQQLSPNWLWASPAEEEKGQRVSRKSSNLPKLSSELAVPA